LFSLKLVEGGLDIFWNHTIQYHPRGCGHFYVNLYFKSHAWDIDKAHFLSAYRCQASWDYILKNCNDEMAPQILDIIDKICSSAQTQMSDPARRIVVGLERSVFFKSVLPSFIHSMAKENYNR